MGNQRNGNHTTFCVKAVYYPKIQRANVSTNIIEKDDSDGTVALLASQKSMPESQDKGRQCSWKKAASQTCVKRPHHNCTYYSGCHETLNMLYGFEEESRIYFFVLNQVLEHFHILSTSLEH